jgi:hypothetical protein
MTRHDDALEKAAGEGWTRTTGIPWAAASEADKRVWIAEDAATIAAYEAHMRPEITTVEELDALPAESNIWGASYSHPGVAGTGVPYTKNDDGTWWDYANGYSVGSDDIMLPARVLHWGTP